MVQLSVFPSATAVMVAVPALWAVRTPFSTEMTASSLLPQDTGWEEAVEGVIVNPKVCCCPTIKVVFFDVISISVTLPGSTSSALTVTVTEEDTSAPPAPEIAAVAVITAVPMLIPVTTPLLTVATAVFSLFQETSWLIFDG